MVLTRSSRAEPSIFGDGLQTQDFVYATDIARANLLAAHADVTDDVFNVASGTETNLNDLAAALCWVMGSDLEPEYGPERAVNPVPRRLADVSRARDLCAHREQPYAGTYDLPHSEAAQDRHIVLPLFPGMTNSDVDRVVARLHQACAS